MLIKYSGNNKFIFIANTKCASTSIEASILGQIADIKLTSSYVGKHMSLEEVYAKFHFIFEEIKLEQFLKFGIIREPLDWVLSWFNYRSRPELKNANHRKHQNYAGKMTFTEFWQLNKNEPFLNPQSQRFFSDENAEIKIDYILRQENLIQGLSLISKVLELDSLEIPKLNQSPKRVASGEKDIEEAVREEIQEKYRSDYDLIANVELFNSRGLERFRKYTTTKTGTDSSTKSLNGQFAAFLARFRKI